VDLFHSTKGGGGAGSSSSSLTSGMGQHVVGKRKRLYKLVDTTALYCKHGAELLKLTAEKYEAFIDR